MAFCPQCGTENDDSARFCDGCGRRLDDVAEARAVMDPAHVGRQTDPAGRRLASDGMPVGDDLDGPSENERLLWEGRPAKLWSPRLALTNRYKLTSERLMLEFGFIGRRTEEIDLFRVDDVAVKQHPFERVTGMGDVVVHTSDTTAPAKILHNIPNPDHVKDLIREASRVERQRRRVFLRDDV